MRIWRPRDDFRLVDPSYPYDRDHIRTRDRVSAGSGWIRYFHFIRDTIFGNEQR